MLVSTHTMYAESLLCPIDSAALSASSWEPGSAINLTLRTLVNHVAFWHLYDELLDRKLMPLISWKSWLTQCEKFYNRGRTGGAEGRST